MSDCEIRPERIALGGPGARQGNGAGTAAWGGGAARRARRASGVEASGAGTFCELVDLERDEPELCRHELEHPWRDVLFQRCFTDRATPTQPEPPQHERGDTRRKSVGREEYVQQPSTRARACTRVYVFVRARVRARARVYVSTAAVGACVCACVCVHMRVQQSARVCAPQPPRASSRECVVIGERGTDRRDYAPKP